MPLGRSARAARAGGGVCVVVARSPPGGERRGGMPPVGDRPPSTPGRRLWCGRPLVGWWGAGRLRGWLGSGRLCGSVAAGSRSGRRIAIRPLPEGSSVVAARAGPVIRSWVAGWAMRGRVEPASNRLRVALGPAAPRPPTRSSLASTPVALRCDWTAAGQVILALLAWRLAMVARLLAGSTQYGPSVLGAGGLSARPPDSRQLSAGSAASQKSSLRPVEPFTCPRSARNSSSSGSVGVPP